MISQPPRTSPTALAPCLFCFADDTDVDVETHDDVSSEAVAGSADVTATHAPASRGSQSQRHTSSHHSVVTQSSTSTSRQARSSTRRSTAHVTSPTCADNSRYWLGQGAYTLPVSVRDGAQVQFNPPPGYKIVEDPLTRQLSVVPGKLARSRLHVTQVSPAPCQAPSMYMYVYMSQAH